jgi:hypothetical protein
MTGSMETECALCLEGKEMTQRIGGAEAVRIAMEASKRGPISLEGSAQPDPTRGDAPAQSRALQGVAAGRRAPPRVRKPSPHHDRCVAPTTDLDGYRARLREAFGDTLSDEFVDVMLGKLVEALRPNQSDQLDEPTLNAGLALINSVHPRSELQALLSVQIVATGFSGLRFLRQSHRHMTEDYIDVYGNYALKLLRLQADLIQTLDRHRRGNRQTVEVRHVHIYPGAQGVVGIVNGPQVEGEG